MTLRAPFLVGERVPRQKQVVGPGEMMPLQWSTRLQDQWDSGDPQHLKWAVR